MYSAERPAGDEWLLVGDAASFVDPLSSAGVKKAMASGWLAAVAVNTALGQPRLKDMAFAFYAAREARDLCPVPGADAAASARRGPRRTIRSGGIAPPAESVASDDRPAVQAAYDRLREAAGLALQLRAACGSRPARPCAEREIVLERQLVTDAVTGGIRYLHGVDVVALAELAPAARDVPGLYEYVASVGPAPQTCRRSSRRSPQRWPGDG